MLLAVAGGCGARTAPWLELADDASVAPDVADGGSEDAGTESVPDAVAEAHGDVSPGECDFGTVVSDVFGGVATFNGGIAVPAGQYRVAYVDGCMKYSSYQGWTVHAYAQGDPGGDDAYWLVAATTMQKVNRPPGTIGWAAGQGAYAAFEDCVAANVMLSPVEFAFSGGVLGVWLLDAPYTDNVAGEGGRSPAWRLTRADCGAQ